MLGSESVAVTGAEAARVCRKHFFQAVPGLKHRDR